MHNSSSNLVYLGLGTNLGDKQNNIDSTLLLLEKRVGNIIAHSNLFITEPVGFVSENDFYNSACIIETRLSPITILEITKRIEIEIGRTSKSVNFQYKDRLIDIDILFYNDEIYSYDNLIIPHPQIQFRSFVLDPLVQIAPDYIHPILNKSLVFLKNMKDRDLQLC